MKTLFLLASVMVVLFLAAPNKVEAQKKTTSKITTGKPALPKFQKGTLYRTIRKKLMTLGWQPVTLPTATPCGDDERCQGFPEVYFCSGVGRAVCQYIWTKKDTLIMVYALWEGDQLYDSLVVSCQRPYPTQIVDPYTCRSESEQKRAEEQKIRSENAKDAQTSSMVGRVIDTPTGVYGDGQLILFWTAIVIEVGNRKYYVPTLGKGVVGLKGVLAVKTVGTIDEVGRTVQIFYTKIVPSSRTTRLNVEGKLTVYDSYDGEIRATKIVEVKK